MGNKYGLGEIIKSARSLLYTKIFYRGARLIRTPINVRGKKSLSGFVGLTTGYSCRFDLEGNSPTLFFGDNCQIGDFVHIVALNNIHIGNNVLIASKVFISDTSHGVYSGESLSVPTEIPSKRQLSTDNVYIDDNVWIGENVVILPGVKIGFGSVIGANSVVTHNIADKSIAVGSPAKVIKYYSDETRKWMRVK